MSKRFSLRSVLVAILAVAVSVPAFLASASAIEIPSVPGAPPEAQPVIDQANELLGQVPPAVSDPIDMAVDKAVAEVLSQIIGLNIPGVAQASSEIGESKATAFEIEGVVTAGEARTTSDGAKVTVLRVGDTDLLTKEGNETGGEWGGELAMAGQIVDMVNEGSCTEQGCVVLIPSSATETKNSNGTYVHEARFALLSVTVGEDGLTVLPMSATTRKDRIFIFERCSDFATAFYATGTGTFAAAALVGPKIAIGGIAAACPAESA